MPSRKFVLEKIHEDDPKLYYLEETYEHVYDDAAQDTMRDVIEFIGAFHQINVTGYRIDKVNGAGEVFSLNADFLKKPVTDFVEKNSEDDAIVLLVKAYDDAKRQKISAAEEAFKAAEKAYVATKLELEKARMPNISGGKRRTRRRR